MQATIRKKGYDSVEQLALGKRTVVFKARSRKLKRPVVIKVLLPHLVGERRFLARFEKDIRVASGITHENLVRILDVGRTESTCFIVCEYYEGVPLLDILSEHPRIPTGIALGIVLRLCHALEAIHAHGLVHRDVRPANIVVTIDGNVKLANIGMATDIGEKGRVTHAGRVTATPAYMSPEQTRGEALGPKSDIFTLGVVGFELLSGKRAFGKGDFGKIVDRIQSNVVPAIGNFNPLVEGPIERLFDVMMSKDPERRCEHVSELLMDLEEVMDKFGYTIGPDELAAWASDPGAYMDQYAERQLEALAARAPIRDGSNPKNNATLLRYYEKIVYLDPDDEGARQETVRLKREAGAVPTSSSRPQTPESRSGLRYASLDPNADYRVILESYDVGRDNEASFALKLSMKLRTPLPRIKSLVRNMPSRVSDRLEHKRALYLAKAIEEAGGRVRLDVCDSETATGREGRTCPGCGWVVEHDAEFCSMCLHSFVGRKIAPAPAMDPDDNPLAEIRAAAEPRIIHRFTDVSSKTKVMAAGVALLFVLFLLTR